MWLISDVCPYENHPESCSFNPVDYTPYQPKMVCTICTFGLIIDSVSIFCNNNPFIMILNVATTRLTIPLSVIFYVL